MKILEVLESDRKKARVLAEGSPFHAAGGGQPGDTGTLEGAGFRAAVRDARKHKGEGVYGDTDKDSFLSVLDLALLSGPETLRAGMEVTAEVDRARNEILSRMHTAQHIFSRLQENAAEGLETLKVNIGTEESAVYVRYEGELTWDALFAAEEKTVEAIRADLPVETLLMSRGDAENIPELKAKWERIHDEEIRVVRVAGIDATACAGTHAARTGEVGGFLVTGFNGSPPEWEVRFTVQADERLAEYGRVARRLLREVGCRPDQLEEVFLRQRAENAALRQTLDKARAYISVPWEERSVGILRHPLYLAVLPGMTKELLSAPARECVAGHPGAFCLVLLPGAVAAEPFPFLLLRGAELSVDLSGFVKEFPELSARGGGKADWLNGTTTQKSVSLWIEAIGKKCEVSANVKLNMARQTEH
ncbi:MAG: alanyl-tRNA editing protein [Synergistaceae bacterium]|jgi:alanyl-tRNA synthetase|nr:alanyl-tRNA editing protein [Synergistaceae bacterium]